MKHNNKYLKRSEINILLRFFVCKYIQITLNDYLEYSGIKVRHIAKELNIDETIISHFRHDRIELSKNVLSKLSNYLQSKQI